MHMALRVHVRRLQRIADLGLERKRARKTLSCVTRRSSDAARATARVCSRRAETTPRFDAFFPFVSRACGPRVGKRARAGRCTRRWAGQRAYAGRGGAIPAPADTMPRSAYLSIDLPPSAPMSRGARTHASDGESVARVHVPTVRQGRKAGDVSEENTAEGAARTRMHGVH
jgi:hypothetical protein